MRIVLAGIAGWQASRAGRHRGLAGIAGGSAMFSRSFCSHTVLPLGEVGVGMLPNEPR